jgi:DNA-binding NarL/FixJ family response regulator
MSRQDIRCVLLADRHPGLMEGLRGLLETTFEAVVMVADEVSLIESATRLEVALAVVDLSLTRGGGLAMVRRLRARCPEMKLIVVSDLDDATVSRSALEAGANGFVLKRAIATDMLAAVDAVLAGQLYVSPKAAKLPAGSQSNQGECI